MPLYEYVCDQCVGVFELLRPAREASSPQPCPQCDEEARRIMPTEFQAFTLRKGAYRRLPDRGKFWHYNREVSGPITSSAPPGEHPELRLRKLRPEQPPTVEERERFEHTVEQRLEAEAESVAAGRPPVRDLVEERKVKEFVKRVHDTSEAARQQRRRDPNSAITPRTKAAWSDPA